MILIGISAFYDDSAAAILVDGKVIAAAQEERFTRIRHDANFPTNAIKYDLNEANIKLEDVNKVIFYDKPLLKFERLLETYLYMSPKGFNSFRMAMPVWLKEKLFLKDLLNKNLKAIGERGKKLIKSKYLWSETTKKTIKLYSWILRAGSKPDFII